MSCSQAANSPQLQLILDWAEGFKKLDKDAIAKYLHKDHRRATYPRSLGKPELTREEWLAHADELLKCWTSIDTTIHSIIEAPGKVVLHLTNKAKTTVEYSRESIMIIQVVTDEDGSLKIGRVEEFTDSKAYLETLQAHAAAKAST